MRIKERVKILFLIGCLLLSFSNASAEEKMVAAPSILPGVLPQMQTAGFWIGRHPLPDKLVMSPAQISRFNAVTRSKGLVLDFLTYPEMVAGLDLLKEIKEIFNSFEGRELFWGDGTRAEKDDFISIRNNISLGAIGLEIPVEYGFITDFADERLLPTEKILTAKQGDRDFDEIQNSGLDAGTPVIVLHHTQDGQWFYVKDEIASGWVKAEKVAITDRRQFIELIKNQRGVVVSAKADIFADHKMTQYVSRVRMGMKLAIKDRNDHLVQVILPQRLSDGSMRLQTVFMRNSDISEGFLSYTPRTILTQAFKLLNVPYGWGDFRGEQDCSRFLQMVFSTVGVTLPRNSSEQAKVGYGLGQLREKKPDDKLKIISSVLGGVSLLRLKGHIMLLLGSFNDRPYAMHAVWAYRQKTEEGEVAYVIGKVAVSDLFLGEGSSRGSLLERLIDIRMISPVLPNQE